MLKVLYSLTARANSEAAFDVVIKLREDLRSTSVQILHFTDHYVHLDPKSFDWSGFKAAIDKYTGSDLSFDLYKTTTISQSDATVDRNGRQDRSIPPPGPRCRSRPKRVDEDHRYDLYQLEVCKEEWMGQFLLVQCPGQQLLGVQGVVCTPQ